MLAIHIAIVVEVKLELYERLHSVQISGIHIGHGDMMWYGIVVWELRVVYGMWFEIT